MDLIGRTITAVLMSGIAVACDSQSSADQPPQKSQAATPAQGTRPAASQPASQPATAPSKARPVVSLLDFGQPPFQALRYSPRTGEKQTVELTIKTSDEPEQGKAQLVGQKYPDIKLTIDVQVHEAMPDGGFRYGMAFTKGEVVDDPIILPAIIERFRKSANAMVGVTAITEVTDRGAVKKSKLDVPAGADAAMVTVLRKADIALEQLWTMVPDEPIGIGGKWRVEYESDASSNNVRFRHSVVYQVASTDGGQIRLTAVVQDHGDRQPMPNSGSNSPFKTVLTSYNGTGRGEFKLDLTQVMPLVAEMLVQTTSNVDIQMDGGGQSVAARFVIESRIETKSN